MATDLWVRRLLLLIALTVFGGLVIDASPEPAEAAIPLTLNGHGYGHGRGMGQWGAYGYATTNAWPHTTILSHFYGGTGLGAEPNSTISVRLYGQDGRDLIVTSGRPFTVGGILVAAGSAARLSIRSDGKFLLNTRYSCSGADVWSTVISSSRVLSTVPNSGNDLNAMLGLCLPTESRQYRGEMALVNDGGAARTVNTVFMDEYLRGVVPSEVPASWADAAGGLGASAVRAQAVAARSYAYAENRSSYAKTCDTTSCQVYSGAGRNGVSLEDPRTTAAVTATYNEVLRSSATGAIARTEFSSSTGGYTAGGTFPVIRDDGDLSSPYHNWVASFSATEAGSALGVGTLLSFEVTSRNGFGAEGGRV
ncbi:MAG: SpoIID/LytB domain-containing protein, partial [Geodermatophilaceae bacterium]